MYHLEPERDPRAGVRRAQLETETHEFKKPDSLCLSVIRGAGPIYSGNQVPLDLALSFFLTWIFIFFLLPSEPFFMFSLCTQKLETPSCNFPLLYHCNLRGLSMEIAKWWTGCDEKQTRGSFHFVASPPPSFPPVILGALFIFFYLLVCLVISQIALLLVRLWLRKMDSYGDSYRQFFSGSQASKRNALEGVV